MPGEITVVETPKRKPRIFKRNRSQNAPKRKRSKEGELTKLKLKLWALTRLLVFKTYGTDCYTCENKNLQGSNCQGGHMPWHSSELSVQCRYDIRFIRAQCFNCNLRKGGKGGTAYLRMVAEGIDVEALWAESSAQKGKTVPIQWFRDKIEEYVVALAQPL